MMGVNRIIAIFLFLESELFLLMCFAGLPLGYLSTSSCSGCFLFGEVLR